MGFMNEKFEKEKEGAQKEQAAEIRIAVTTAVVAATERNHYFEKRN